MKNVLISLIVQLMRLFAPNIKTTSSRFLILSTTGLGDTVFSLPAIQALREAHPKGYIAVLTTALGKELLYENSEIDELIVTTAHSPLSLWNLLRKKYFDTVFVFHVSQRIFFPIATSIGAIQTITTKNLNKGLDYLFTDITDDATHEIDRRLNQLKALDISPNPTPPNVQVTKEEISDAETVLQRLGWNGEDPIVVLQHKAKDRFKEWPREYFTKLGVSLLPLSPLIIITGSYDEAQSVQDLSRTIKGSIPFFGQFSLRQILGVLKLASLLISNDTGIMHLGFATNCPTLGLFAPTHHLSCGPYLATNAFVIQKNRSCTPCLRKRCQDPFCMRQIGPEEVFIYAKAILEGRT